MKQAFFAALALALFWVILPVLTADRPGELPAAPETTAETNPPPTETGQEAAPSDTARPPEASFDREFFLPVLREGQVVSMDLHTYLTGVLLGEIPDSFAPEARKAQAVACRTYCLRGYTHRRHGSAAVCTDPGCCQAWADPEQADPTARAKAEQAVADTDGLVIRYGDELIDATFFSCSGGRTEEAAAVWGTDLPYLQSVDSPGEEGAVHFTDELRLSLADFQAALLQEDGDISLPEALGGWVGQVTYTAGGGVETMVLGGRPFSGMQLRRLFGLRSTAFTLRLTEKEAIFTTRGFGHRVGLSQYGAEAMARAGKDFREILKWYYRGVEIGTAEAGK